MVSENHELMNIISTTNMLQLPLRTKSLSLLYEYTYWS